MTVRCDYCNKLVTNWWKVRRDLRWFYICDKCREGIMNEKIVGTSRYAVAIFNNLDGSNKIYVVEAPDSCYAIIEAVIKYSDGDENISEWVKNMYDLTKESLLNELSNGELIVTDPIMI